LCIGLKENGFKRLFIVANSGDKIDYPDKLLNDTVVVGGNREQQLLPEQINL